MNRFQNPNFAVAGFAAPATGTNVGAERLICDAFACAVERMNFAANFSLANHYTVVMIALSFREVRPTVTAVQ
jgi:hypothetical protein